jgi:YcxB-like protein
MKLEFETTIEDLVDFNEYFAFVVMKRASQKRAFVTGIFVSIVGSFFVYQETKHLVSSLVVGLILLMMLTLLLPAVERDRVRKTVRKIYSDPSAKDDAIGHQILNLTDTGIHSISSGSESSTQSGAVNNVVFTPKHCFLFIGPAKAHIVPKRAFLEPGAIESHIRNFVPQDKVEGTWLSGA